MTANLSVLGRLAPAALGRDLTEDEASKFAKYQEILLKWQRSQRLVGSGEPDWIQRELLADSLLFCRFIAPGPKRLLDFGSGAGIPGIPLKIVRRELEVVLLESRARRVSFLRAVIRGLDLAGLCAVGGRAEHAAELAGRFDVVTARCTGDLETVAALATRFLTPDGELLLTGPPRPPERPDIEWQAVAVPGLGTRHIGIYRAASRRAHRPEEASSGRAEQPGQAPRGGAGPPCRASKRGTNI